MNYTFALILGLLIVLAVLARAILKKQHPKATVERFNTPSNDDDRKRDVCRNKACAINDEACVEKCFSEIKSAHLCPNTVTKVDRTDARRLKWSNVNGVQCLHA